jgi:hypothetical protein
MHFKQVDIGLESCKTPYTTRGEARWIHNGDLTRGLASRRLMGRQSLSLLLRRDEVPRSATFLAQFVCRRSDNPRVDDRHREILEMH